MEWPRASIVIPVRDAESLIGGALDAIAAQRYDGEFEVIVVDNGSLDATATAAERHPVAPRVVRRVRGEGPGAARNDGVVAATGDVVAFTDADCRPTPGWLAAGARAIADRALVQGAVSAPPGEPIGPFDHTLWVHREYGLYETANLFVRREWFHRVGGFEDIVDPAHGRPFGEDAWFAWRIRRAGGETGFAADALVHHAVIAGDVSGWIREHARRRHFPELVKRIPELREEFLHRRVFLTRTTLEFDVALVGGVAALVARRPSLLVLALPYLRGVRRRALGWPHPARHAVAQVAADAVGAAALVAGSIESRSVVL